jgi:hypothetical protein
MVNARLRYALARANLVSVPVLTYVVLFALLPASAFLAAMVLISRYTAIPIADLTRDPASIMGVPFYSGAVSQIGVAIWAMTVAICLFSAALVSQKSSQAKVFLLASGAVTGMLLVDDMFLVHEGVARRLFNISDRPVYAAYLIVLLSYLVLFRQSILRSDFLPLVLSFLFFAASLVVDVKLVKVEEQYLYEDGLKFVGLVLWAAYFARLASQLVRQHFTVPGGRE